MIRSLVRILAAPGSGNCSIVTNTLVHTENDGKTRVGCQGKLFLGWCKYKWILYMNSYNARHDGRGGQTVIGSDPVKSPYHTKFLGTWRTFLVVPSQRAELLSLDQSPEHRRANHLASDFRTLLWWCHSLGTRTVFGSLQQWQWSCRRDAQKC